MGRRGQLSTELIVIFAALTLLGTLWMTGYLGTNRDGAVFKAGNAATEKIAKDQ